VDLFDLITWAWTHLLVIPMTNLLVLFTVFAFGNFGIAIILFTIFMRLLTWPVQLSQFKSMRAMQEVQPRIQELQKKYKDPQRRSEETMKLYREAGVNPLGCIWPMLIQFPIWIALYQAIRITLGSTPESLFTLTSERLYSFDILRNAVPLDPHFLWMNLGQPDTTFIMAILTGATTYVQQKMTTPQTANVDPQQAQMNQTMTIMMPLVFAYMTLQFPSGLALYWVATNVIGIALQYFYMGRRISWRQLLPLPAPAPAPAAKEDTGEATSPPAPTADESADAPEGGEEALAQRRRRRRGRRRRR
jgi:YidC/Oxa1 family membrane protein insertase